MLNHCARTLLFVSFAWAATGCASTHRASESRARIFDGLGNHTRPVATSSAEAQRYFDQGLMWAYSFNHDEAIRSFTRAAELDPRCAMAWWGVALCHGPHVNFPIMTPERSVAAWDALGKARGLRENARPIDRALIDALSKRYAAPPVADRRPLDEAYAAAMRDVWHANRGDADIGALYAESLMDLQPWDYWAKDGSPKGNSNEIVAVLEEVLRLNPDHPGGLHLYIHAVEASAAPERAVAAADRLRNLVPAAGHMVHMPSHIDIRVGRWRKAAEANERAIAADRAYRKLSPRQEFYRIYMAHNQHFLAFTAMMEGRSDEALRVAREMLAAIPADYATANAPLVDAMMPFETEVLMRFGRWDDILAAPSPRAEFPIAVAMWRFARGVAFAAKDDVDAALREENLFRQAVAAVPADAMVAINKAHQMLAIGEHMLRGEIEFRQKRVDAAIASLRKAIEIEDSLLYMEPPEWLQPVRHALGAILVHEKRYVEAEQVYRADLKVWPENGWSLHGLAESLRLQGKTRESAAVREQFENAWARADIQIGSSCICVAGAE